MSAITTFAPSFTNFSTIPFPKPEAPPVTMAVLLFKRVKFPLI